jgi:hypothetical protein
MTHPPESPIRARTQKGYESVAHCRHALFATAASLFAAQLLVAATLAAQAPGMPTSPLAQPALAHPSAHPHKKPAAQKLVAQPAPVPAPAPVAPPLPNWPANKKPDEASVVWDSHGLLIQASNSSLDQILNEISLKTGARVEGMGADERIFGTYGPGPAREVLGELLEGSGYNILMIGDLGEGTPRRIVLSGRAITPSGPSGNTNPGGNGDNDTENDQEAQQAPEPEQPQPSQPQAPAYQPGPGVPVRSPQQIFQERQQQMMQLQRQQQQQQQQNGQQNPQN